MVCTNDNGTKFLAGIASWGTTCGHPSFPGVFSHIFNYADWIEKTISDSTRSNHSDKTRRISSLSELFSFLIVIQYIHYLTRNLFAVRCFETMFMYMSPSGRTWINNTFQSNPYRTNNLMPKV